MSVTKSEGTGGKFECLRVVVHKDERGYGMTVSGNDPVIVQSVVKQGAAWRAGVRYGDRLIRVNGIAVESSVHQDVVDMIKSSNLAELTLQRTIATSKITAPLPVDKERQRIVENTKIQTIQRMLESELSHIENLRSVIARGGSDRIPELEMAENRKSNLQQQIDKLGQSSISTLPNRVIVSDIDPPVTPPRQSFLSNLPRSLSSLTGQSLRGNRNSQPPVTCLDGAPPPLPPRTPNTLSPGSLSPRGPSPGGQVPRPPPSGGMGHQRSRSSPEQLGKLDNSTDKEWEMVVTPPGTPPPPYPSTPLPQVPVEPQRPIISMEEEDSPCPMIRGSFFNEGFSNVDTLSPVRMAIFLNWIIGERRPSQAALFYLLSATYSLGPSDFLARWAYELHSAFLVPGAPLALRSVDENIAKEIDDVLMNESNKDNLKKVFLKAREKAKDELNQQLNDFQLKRQSGLGSFYGPADSVLEYCDHDKQKEISVITDWLLPQFQNWLKESATDSWDATFGSHTVSILAAAVHPLIRHFGLKSQVITDMLKSPAPGSPPRPEFLQTHRHYKQRVTYLKKSTAHPLIIRGHHLSPIAVESVRHCHHCHLLIWGIAPQAYICSDCKLLVHRSCSKDVEESCCGPVAQPTRKSRFMDKLAPPALTSNIGISHQNIDPNQHFYHHHHHDKKQRKSLGTSHFLNMERSSKRFDEDGHAADMSASYHHPGDGRRDTDDSGADSSHHTDSSHLLLEHSLDIADNSKHSVRPRPVTKAESFRDRAAKVQRTKRKTSDPNQLTSGNPFNDAEGTGILGAPSGGSSSSSLSSRSNESAGPIDNHDSHLEASEEEESAEPWSTKAPAEILVSMTPKARKRQDLIHELITSEVSHLRWLRILRQVFHNPLQQSSLLPTGELKALFPNLPDVLQRHRKLCSDLKALSAASPVIQTKPLADALIMTLGEPKYPGALANFCGGQRLALDALRERRRRTKELHTFLAKCEQDPLCTRLRLQDFLAFVWQRLTKYQLLLEGIIKTGKDDDDEDDLQNPEDGGLARLNKALEIAKEVLVHVNTTVKTTENRHRLKTIQSKLEVRGVGSSGSETLPGELKRMDLTRHLLIMEGTLNIRQDSTKRIALLALLLDECLVLLQREADKFILRPISQATHQLLSPIIRWDTVFFRPNAAVKNGFFLVNINGIQMYELSATSSSEYNTWTKHLSESAKALGPRSGTVEEGPPPPLPPNPPPTPIPSSDVISNGTSEPNTSIEEDKEEPPEPPKNEDDGKQISGAVQTVEGESSDTKGPSNINTIIEELIIPSSVAVVTPPIAFTAERLLTPEERLRQAEEKVTLGLREVAHAAKETVSSARLSVYSAMESLIGKSASGKQQRASIGNGLDHETIQEEEDPQLSTIHLLLMAQTHVDNLTEVLLKAFRVSPADCSMTRCTLHTDHGLCDTCSARHSKYSSTVNESDEMAAESAVGEDASDPTVVEVCNTVVVESQAEEKLDSIVLLEEVGESSTDPYIAEPEANLVTTSAIGLRQILTTLMSRLPAVEKEREFLRARLQQTDQRLHRLHHLHKDCVISENSSGSSIDTIQEVPNSNSTDQSGGEG
ncbi:rho guanine nucleotide exchange factor 2 isoform X3 [Arctopsyche grandis]|uniref:rho guanine nucleotide exchange factor 2 isoform X3 n=1 Tax=Arctopsyche grandis TaxID=121162 RepID=UPI00406D8930